MKRFGEQSASRSKSVNSVVSCVLTFYQKSNISTKQSCRFVAFSKREYCQLDDSSVTSEPLWSRCSALQKGDIVHSWWGQLNRKLFPGTQLPAKGEPEMNRLLWLTMQQKWSDVQATFNATIKSPDPVWCSVGNTSLSCLFGWKNGKDRFTQHWAVRAIVMWAHHSMPGTVLHCKTPNNQRLMNTQTNLHCESAIKMLSADMPTTHKRRKLRELLAYGLHLMARMWGLWAKGQLTCALREQQQTQQWCRICANNSDLQISCVTASEWGDLPPKVEEKYLLSRTPTGPKTFSHWMKPSVCFEENVTMNCHHWRKSVLGKSHQWEKDNERV